MDPSVCEALAELGLEDTIQSKVEKKMGLILQKLPDQGNPKLNAFLRSKIKGLKIDKREQIGVFGRTGAGKSSLINAIIGEKGLLPTGGISACTSVMIKVEANPNKEYEADIEFITPEEWEKEMSSMKQILDENQGKKNDEINEMLSALYGEEWKEEFPENPVDIEYFSEAEEFLQSEKKTLKCKSAKDLSAELSKYTKSDSDDREGQKEQKCYWPVVKCVTVKVPDNDLLQHVTLVDLPGCGDRNKSRDEMWKKIVGSCSTVWIVADIKRATSEREAWEILENTCSLMGNGGECQQIHFICTMSDVTGVSDDDSEDDVRTRILQKNRKVKEKVKQDFLSLDQVKKHFGDDCFKVLTVSSKEFLKKEHLNPEDTEIPKLQDVLKELNDCHSEALSYVSGAYGLLSLMQGARSTEGAGKKTAVCAVLKENLSQQLAEVKKAVEAAHKVFETRLTEGVENSKRSCEQTLKSVIDPPGRSGSSFHRTLKCVVQKDGVHTTNEGERINLNETLASWLTNSIDEEFRKTFPNKDKRGPFSGAISKFSLDTKRLTEENPSLKLQLTFLQTEEENIKRKLNQIIWMYKKTIYSSLTETIKKNMLDCYRKAAGYSGKDTLRNMRVAIEDNVHDSKDTMFEKAKAAMLKKMIVLKRFILKELKETLEKSIDLAMTADSSIPDVQEQLKMVKKYYDLLKLMAKKKDATVSSTSGQQ